MTRNEEYARPELLAEPTMVWERRGDPALRIVDCGPSRRTAGPTSPAPWDCRCITGSRTPPTRSTCWDRSRSR